MDSNHAEFARPISGGRFIDKVAWIHIRDRGVLMGRRRGSNEFINIGGKREKLPDFRSETDVETLVREVREEVGVEIVPDSAALLCVFKGKAANGVPLQIRAYTADHLGLPVPHGELEELAYLTSKDKHRTTPMGVEILEWLRAMKIID